MGRILFEPVRGQFPETVAQKRAQTEFVLEVFCYADSRCNKDRVSGEAIGHIPYSSGQLKGIRKIAGGYLEA